LPSSNAGISILFRYSDSGEQKSEGLRASANIAGYQGAGAIRGDSLFRATIIQLIPPKPSC
jgi:hypothetical protein